MIRGCFGKTVLIAILIVISYSASFGKIEVTKDYRMITLTGAYAGENIKISFVANDDSISSFTYLTPLEYDQTIAKIWFTKSERDKSSLSFSRNIFSYVSLR